MARPFVLVPGCWTGGWAWHPVARQLEDRGHQVVVVDMPGMSAGDDPRTASLGDATAALVGALERHDLFDVVLVAHDWSAYPVTAASHRAARRIAKVVYWSAFVPAADESMLEAMPAEDKAMLLGRAKASGSESVLVPFERWRGNFVQTAPAPIQQLTYSLLRPQPMAYLAESLPASQAAIPDLPVAYLLGTADLSLPEGEEWWTKYALRLGVEPVLFDGCHAAHLTDPHLVAEQLIAVAGA